MKREKKIRKRKKDKNNVHSTWYTVIDAVLVSPADTVTYSYSPCIAQFVQCGVTGHFEHPVQSIQKHQGILHDIYQR